MRLQLALDAPEHFAVVPKVAHLFDTILDGDFDAEVLRALTTESTELGRALDEAIVIDTAGTQQFGGTLFEQAAIVLGDSVVFHIAQQRDDVYEIMAYRHTNLQ